MVQIFPQVYVFLVEVDSESYPAVHELFMHQTVFIRYTFSSDGKANKVTYQPDPMTKEDSRILLDQIKRTGAKVKINAGRPGKA